MVAWHVEPWQHFILTAILGLLLAYAFSSGIIASAGGSTPSQTFVLPDKRILKFGLIAFCCLVCEGSMFDWSGVYFNKVVAAPAEKATIGYTAFMASMAAGRFIADRMVWSLGARRVLIGSGILIFAGLSLAVLFPTLLSATLGFALVGFGVSSVVPIVYSMAGRSTHMHPSQALAAVSTVGFAGFLFGPPFIGLVAEATSLKWSFALVACFGLCTSILSASFAAGTGTKPV
jgi:MFS family permease